MAGRFLVALAALAIAASPASAQRIGVGVGVGLGGSGSGGGLPTLSSLSGAAPADAPTGTVLAVPQSSLSGCAWSIASQANFAQSSSTGAITKAVANVSTGSYAPATTCTVTANSQTITVSAPLALTITAGAPATALLLGSRYNVMGFNGYVGSDGTDTNSNSRIASWNETGASVTKLRAYYANWFANATNEQDGYNPITVTAAIEYPAGTVTPVTFGGSGSTTIPATGSASLAESDEVTLATAIPAGAQYWMRTYVSVAAGGKWPQGYLTNTSNGEAVDFSTGVDKTAGATITNATASATRRSYGPVALKATGFSGASVGKAFAVIGDSLMMGATDVNIEAGATAHGNMGFVAKAMAGYYPVINLGIAGTAAQYNLPANYTRRTALLAKVGVTNVFGDFGNNDLPAARSATQIASDISSIATALKSALPGIKVTWMTITPRTSSTDTWRTAANQTLYSSYYGTPRLDLNTAIRAGISGVDSVFDAADQIEVNGSNALTRGGLLWISGNGGVGATSTHLTTNGSFNDQASTDGWHPSTTSTGAPGLGGIYILRDAVRSAVAGW